MQAHRDLAIGGFAERARILARHTDRVLALFRKSRIVDQPGCGREGFRYLLRQALPNGLPRPRALADELLQVLLIALGQALGHGADAFALPVQQKTTNIDAAPMTTLAPAERGQHLRGERFQALAALA